MADLSVAVYQNGGHSTIYYIPTAVFAAAVRAVIAQESAPREPAQERQGDEAGKDLAHMRLTAERDAARAEMQAAWKAALIEAISRVHKLAATQNVSGADAVREMRSMIDAADITCAALSNALVQEAAIAGMCAHDVLQRPSEAHFFRHPEVEQNAWMRATHAILKTVYRPTPTPPDTAPREPAQERQGDESTPPAPKDDGAAFYAAQLRKHADSATINDFVRVDLGAARKIADALDRVTTAQQAGGADPLLPGQDTLTERLRGLVRMFEVTFSTERIAAERDAARTLAEERFAEIKRAQSIIDELKAFREQALTSDPLLPGLRYVREHYHASPGIMTWLDAEIARREGI